MVPFGGRVERTSRCYRRTGTGLARVSASAEPDLVADVDLTGTGDLGVGA